jgi:hypothetical protein
MDKLTAEEIEKIIGDAIDSSAPRDVIIREATKAIIQSLAEKPLTKRKGNDGKQTSR